MKRKFLVGLAAVVTALCMMFGIAACGETENSGDSNSDEQQQEQEQEQEQEQHIHSFGEWKVTKEATCTARGEQQRECTVCGKKESSSFPAKGHSFYQGKCIVCGASDPNAEQQPNDGKGEEQKPNKPSENQIEVEVYIDNVLSETLYTDSSKGNKITLPKKPEDMTTDPELDNYFDGWYADRGYNTPLTGEETYRSASAIYGRNIRWHTYDFKYEVHEGEATITRYLNSTATVVVVPGYINSFPVVEIADRTFKDKTMIRSIFICEGPKKIGAGAFSNCNTMQKVVIPSTVTSIESRAFDSCSSLKSITIPASVTEIGEWVFSDCDSLERVSIPSGMKKIEDHMFSGCSSLQSIAIPDSMTSIGEGAFYGCSSLKSVTIPDNVTKIGRSAFHDCDGLESMTIGSGVTEIGDYAFRGCKSLQSIVFPKSLKYLGDLIFSHDIPCYFRGSRGDVECGIWWNVYSFSYRGTNVLEGAKYLSTVVWEYEG